MTADLEPFVVGRCLPGAGQTLPERVRIEREDGGDVGGVDWRSADATLSAEGSFVLQVRLERSRRNRFRVRAFDRAGAEVALATRAFAIVHGVSIGDPPLARAIGVARADDSTQVYFAKGTPLPARRTFVHHTVQADRRGQRRRRAGRSDRAGRVDPRAPQPPDRHAAPARRRARSARGQPRSR